ncbi:MAG: hypothetical protein IT381_12675 [Deltaproteobacteria bacterium]|nr:hypothetical protein [Deltaproteobacteria bacterium]
MRSSLLLVALSCAACTLPAFASTEDTLGPIPRFSVGSEGHRGVALGMYDQNPDADYTKAVDEIVETGATHISLIVVYFQETVTSTTIAPRKGYTPSVANIRKTLKHAKQKGLAVMLFPIVHITTRGPGDWRGKLRPDDWDLWFGQYTVFIGEMARLAAEAESEFLVVGSEYVTTETMRDRWLKVIAHVRAIFTGKLLYSANWDHFDPVSFWDAVDVAGVTAYHKLTANNLDPNVTDMVNAWDPVKRRLRQFQKRIGRPLVITEIGYPTLDGANAYPWDETRGVAIDMEEQRRCYEAFTRAFEKEPAIFGLYFWIWFGPGGPQDRGFSPRGKPAATVIRDFFRKPETSQR